MKNWQEYLDAKFPEGAILQVKNSSDPDEFAVLHVPRIWVVLDEPAPMVTYFGLEAPLQIAPHRLVDWSEESFKEGTVATTHREDGVEMVFSNILTEFDRAIMKPYKDKRPVWRDSLSSTTT